MTPRGIVEQAHDQELDIIAVCDHNSAENAGAAIRAGIKAGLHVLPGMEICSREEVHLLAIFDALDQAAAMQAVIYSNLQGENRPEVFGFQVIADENDEVAGENPRLLIGATLLGVYEIATIIHSLAGICIAAHVDRPSYSIISQLGFIPPDIPLDGIEVSRHSSPDWARSQIQGIGNRACITSSDSHYRNTIGSVWTTFQLASPSAQEIRLALMGQEGRKVI